MTQTESVLQAVDLSRSFETAEGKIDVLKGVTFGLERGQMSAVTGVSGVGKSTLLHILGGLDRPTHGEVRLGNSPIAGLSEKELARLRSRHLGFVFQFHYLLEDFTALENVMIPMLLAQKPNALATARAELLLETVGLKDRRSHRPKALSGGEQQRVAVARALANEPDIVLADEPSGNLDTATGEKLHELLHQIRTEHSTSFLIATHNRSLAQSCDKTYQLAEGRLTEISTGD